MAGGTVIDQLIVTLGLGPEGFIEGANKAKAANKGLRDDASATASHLSREAEKTKGSTRGLSDASSKAAQSYVKDAETTEYANKGLRDDASITASHLEAKGKIASTFFSGMKLEALGLIAVITAGGKSLEDLMVNSAAATAAVGRFSEATGTNPAQLSGLQNVAKEYGSSAEALNSSLQTIYGSIASYRATGQLNNAVNALSHMGISQTDQNGKPLDTSEIMLEVAKWMKGHDTQTDMVFGQMLGMSPDLVNAYNKTPDLPGQVKLQSSVTPQSAAAGEKITQADAALKVQFDKAQAEVMTILSPNFVTMTDNLTKLVAWLVSDPLAKELPKLENEIKTDLAPKFDGLINAIKRLLDWFDGTGKTGEVSNDVPIDTSIGPKTSDAQWQAQLVAESGDAQSWMGKPITSSKGAVGIAQLLPATAEEVAKKHNIAWNLSEFQIDAGYNSRLGRLYMDDQLKTFNGNAAQALAAYNWGPGNVQKDVAAHGKDWLSYAPQETQDYVRKIMSSPSYSAPPDSKPGLVASAKHVEKALRETPHEVRNWIAGHFTGSKSAADAAATQHSVHQHLATIVQHVAAQARATPLPANVIESINRLRAQTKIAHHVVVHAPITVDGSKNPAVTGKATKAAVSSLVLQGNKGIYT